MLETALRQPPRSQNDWSIVVELGHSCDLCEKLTLFLRSPAVKYPWPLAESARSHVHRMLDQNDLPVGHTTIRQGRPYTLMLTKLPALFEREEKRRADEAAMLDRIRKLRPAATLSRRTQ